MDSKFKFVLIYILGEGIRYSKKVITTNNRGLFITNFEFILGKAVNNRKAWTLLWHEHFKHIGSGYVLIL